MTTGPRRNAVRLRNDCADSLPRRPARRCWAPSSARFATCGRGKFRGAGSRWPERRPPLRYVQPASGRSRLPRLSPLSNPSPCSRMFPPLPGRPQVRHAADLRRSPRPLPARGSPRRAGPPACPPGVPDPRRRRGPAHQFRALRPTGLRQTHAVRTPSRAAATDGYPRSGSHQATGQLARLSRHGPGSTCCPQRNTCQCTLPGNAAVERSQGRSIPAPVETCGTSSVPVPRTVTSTPNKTVVSSTTSSTPDLSTPSHPSAFRRSSPGPGEKKDTGQITLAPRMTLRMVRRSAPRPRPMMILKRPGRRCIRRSGRTAP